MTEKTTADGLIGFSKLCLEAESDQQLKQLFDLFFTIEEREMLSSRYLIIMALLEGKLTQREIAEEYQVSIAQITRGSNALKIIDKNILTLLTRHRR